MQQIRMFWIALAAHLSAPQPVNYEAWFSSNDVPAHLMGRDGVWFVGVRAIVRPDGSLQACEIEVPTKDEKLNALSCRLLTKRAKYRPARWIDGSAVYGVDRFPFLWAVLSDPKPIVRPPDLDVQVARLPKGLKSPVYVAVMFASDASGKISSCVVDKRRRSERNSEHRALVAVACRELEKSYTAIPARTATGVPAPSVQNALVRFTTRP